MVRRLLRRTLVAGENRESINGVRNERGGALSLELSTQFDGNDPPLLEVALVSEFRFYKRWLQVLRPLLGVFETTPGVGFLSDWATIWDPFARRCSYE
jgi:hypothetical protein